jgi:hypothetical protein
VTITLVDVESASVARTILADAPIEMMREEPAACWRSQGREAIVRFSEDGASLLLSGASIERSGADTARISDWGIRRVDLRNDLTSVARLPYLTGSVSNHEVIWADDEVVFVVATSFGGAGESEPKRTLLELSGGSLNLVQAVAIDGTDSSLLASPRRLAPLKTIPAKATPVGMTSLLVRALGGDVERVLVEVDGMVVFEGPLASGEHTAVLTGMRVTITSSHPARTSVVTVGGMIRMMREETETYPRE